MKMFFLNLYILDTYLFSYLATYQLSSYIQ